MQLHQVLRFLFLVWPINVKPEFTLPVVLIIDAGFCFVVGQDWGSSGRVAYWIDLQDKFKDSTLSYNNLKFPLVSLKVSLFILNIWYSWTPFMIVINGRQSVVLRFYRLHSTLSFKPLLLEAPVSGRACVIDDILFNPICISVVLFNSGLCYFKCFLWSSSLVSSLGQAFGLVPWWPQPLNLRRFFLKQFLLFSFIKEENQILGEITRIAQGHK